MKYIYDIILNFNEEFYEFYEWDEKDYFDYIKRIPIIKVTKDMLNDIKNKKIILNSDTLQSMFNMCEVYSNKSIKYIEYACLFCSNSSIVAVEFNYKGTSIMRSDLLIDEALDVIEFCKKIKPTNLEYKIMDDYGKKLVTREEANMLIFMKREINNMYKNNNINKLKYIYYECFNRYEDSIIKIYEELMSYINSFPKELYNLLMLPYQNSLQK